MKVFIQNEAGSYIKNYHNEKTLEWLRAARVCRAYPFPYGFILDTTAEDGCNVDCFVLTTQRLRTGQVVECDPVGLMEQIEDGKEDHNVLAVMRRENERVDETTKSQLIKFVSHVFDHIEGKAISIGGFLGAEAAFDHITRHTMSKVAEKTVPALDSPG